MVSSDTEKLAAANEMIDAWNRLDWERVIELFAPQGYLHSMMETLPTVGRDAIRARLEALTKGASEVRIELRNAGVINGTVFLERVDNFVVNDKSGSMPVVGVLEIDDGLVIGWREYYDRSVLLTEMGLTRDFVEDH
jgi:limonene-1,2-epoxide hydrolase